LEAEIETIRNESRGESQRVAAEFQPRIEALTEKVRTLEAERESAVANVRQEAEKRLQKQMEDLNRLKQQLENEASRCEKLEQRLDTEKNRQAASLRPVLVTLLVALLVGLGGGFAYRKMNQPSRPDAEWVKKQGFANEKLSEPITWGQFKVFAESIGQPADKLLLEGGKTGKDNEPVKGVSWYVAQRFCDWLTAMENSGTHEYVLPELEDLKIGDNKWVWTSSWRRPAADGGEQQEDEDESFIGFLTKNDKNEVVELPPGMATKDTSFRVKRRELE